MNLIQILSDKGRFDYLNSGNEKRYDSLLLFLLLLHIGLSVT